MFVWRRKWFVRLMALPVTIVVGWWAPSVWLYSRYPPDSAAAAQMPFLAFGAIGALYVFLLAVCRQLSAKSLGVHLLMAIASGCVGALYWWVAWGPLYFSLLHGAIWGSLVGFGVWKIQQSDRI